MPTWVDGFVVFDGQPVRLFPVGAHTFPADLEALRDWVAAVRAVAHECHSLAPVALDEHGARPLQLTALMDFLARRRPSVEAQLGPAAALASQRYATERLRCAGALGAPPELLEHHRAWCDRVAMAGWRPRVDPRTIVPDAVEHARIVDVESRRRHGWPLRVDVDISSVVLLALQCCIAPTAVSVSPPPGLAWVELELSAMDDGPDADDAIRVGVSVYREAVERIAIADVRGRSDAAELSPQGGLVSITMPATDGG